MVKIFQTALLLFSLAVLGCGSDSSGDAFQLGTLEVITGPGVLPVAEEYHLRFDATGSIIHERYVFSDRMTLADSWQDQLTSAEKANLEALCDGAGVLVQRDISAPAGQPPCVGSTAIHVLASSSTGLQNSFIISADALCNPDLIPSGVNALLAETERLEAKYWP